MGEYNKTIEELLQEFKDLQIYEIVRQINMNTGGPIGSSSSNNPGSLTFEQEERSIPTE